MLSCLECGYKMSKIAKFCPEFGAPIAPKDKGTSEKSSIDAGKTQRRVGDQDAR